MRTVHTIQALRSAVNEARGQGLRVALVPTMGNLHEGHLALIDEAKKHADFVVASIFVNPMQFGANEDLDAYPRTLEADSLALAEHYCDLLFAPSVNEVYPNGLDHETRVEVPVLGDLHCGASRPGHFVGVATVVTKLFNMVQPDLAVFGEKDFQQLAIIRKMTQDLCLPIEIRGLATSREASGLARSSRNGYLSAAEKDKASAIYQVLTQCHDKLKKLSADLETVRLEAIQTLEDNGFRVDYLNFAETKTLRPATAEDQHIVVLLAAFMGTTRLIDNIVIARE